MDKVALGRGPPPPGGLEPLQRYNLGKMGLALRSEPLQKPLQGVTRGVTNGVEGPKGRKCEVGDCSGYGIRPRVMRMGEQVGRGYVEEEMLETFRRYIPRAELERAKAEVRERTVRPGATPAGGGKSEGPARPESGGGSAEDEARQT